MNTGDSHAAVKALMAEMTEAFKEGGDRMLLTARALQAALHEAFGYSSNDIAVSCAIVRGAIAGEMWSGMILNIDVWALRGAIDAHYVEKDGEFERREYATNPYLGRDR